MIFKSSDGFSGTAGGQKDHKPNFHTKNIDINSPAAQRAFLAHDLVVSGTGHLAQNRHQDAITDLTMAIELDHKNLIVYVFLGMAKYLMAREIIFSSGEQTESKSVRISSLLYDAKDNATTAIEQGVVSVELRTIRGRAYLALGQLESIPERRTEHLYNALCDFRVACLIHTDKFGHQTTPGIASIYHEIANTHAELGMHESDLQKSISHLEDACMYFELALTSLEILMKKPAKLKLETLDNLVRKIESTLFEVEFQIEHRKVVLEKTANQTAAV